MGKKEAFFWSSLIFLLFFKPLVAFKTYSPLDDQCYHVFAAKVLGYNELTCEKSDHTHASALVWLPATLANGVQKFFFQHEYFLLTFPVWVGVLSFFYWIMSFWLLSKHFSARQALVFLLCIPALYYSTHRTSLLHAPELFFAIGCFHLLSRQRYGLAFVSALVLTFTRYNDFFALLMVMAVWMSGTGRSGVLSSTEKNKKFVLGAACFGVVLVGAVLSLKLFKFGYHSLNLNAWAGRLNSERLGWVLWGGDWGLLWTGLPWLSIFLIGVLKFRRLSSQGIFSILWMTGCFLICWGWRGNGSDFGYRYLIGSYVAAWFVWKEISQTISKRHQKWFLNATSIQAIFMTWLTFIYKESEALTPLKDSIYPWTRPDLIKNALASIFDSGIYYNAVAHSPLGSLLASIFNSDGVYSIQTAFNPPQSTFALFVTGVLSIMSIGTLIYITGQLLKGEKKD